VICEGVSPATCNSFHADISSGVRLTNCAGVNSPTCTGDIAAICAGVKVVVAAPPDVPHQFKACFCAGLNATSCEAVNPFN